MSDIYSILLVVLIIATSGAISLLFYRLGVFSSETTRKFIHILVSNSVFICAYNFESLGFAVLGPCLFIIINYLGTKSKYAASLGMTDSARHIGLVYYPASLALLVFLKYTNYIEAQDLIAGILVMGYGDGLAALYGSKFGKKKIGRTGKTLEGSIILFFAAILVMVLFTNYNITMVVVIALIAAVIELYSKNGFDNISVPLITAFLGAVLC